MEYVGCGGVLRESTDSSKLVKLTFSSETLSETYMHMSLCIPFLACSSLTSQDFLLRLQEKKDVARVQLMVRSIQGARQCLMTQTLDFTRKSGNLHVNEHVII